MITRTEAKRVLGVHFAAIPDLWPVSWSGKASGGVDFNPQAHAANGRFVVFDHIPTGSNDPTLKGEGASHEGYLSISAVMLYDGFDTPVGVEAERIAGYFPKSLRITGTGGRVLINRPPQLQPPYTSGPYRYQPVRITYVTEF